MIKNFLHLRTIKRGIKLLINFEKTVILRNKSYLNIKYIVMDRQHMHSSNAI
jgi:hypothetical protein